MRRADAKRSDDSAVERRRTKAERDIHNVSAWILRAGVVSSVAVMLLGLAAVFVRNPPTVDTMQSRPFSADFGAIVSHAAAGDGVAIMEIGILMLVLTPILRVASSMVLFAVEERDWFYAFVTFLVLGLTLGSLLVLR